MIGTRKIHGALAALVALAATSCAGPTAVRGGHGTDLPDLDKAAMSTGLDKVDLDYLMKENLDKLFASRAWARFRGAPEEPVVAIWPIRNDTTEHIENQLNTLLATVESRMVESGDVRVVSRERQREMAQEVGLQNTNAVYDPALAARLSKQVGAQYFLTGKIQAVDERAEGERRVQYTLTLQLIEVETSVIEFQNSTARTKAIVR
ncbi:MAG TPA: hypothetical protein VN033_02940 [Vulgatibacter sp.]|nr:hypothetical protein [Vulgatibacter sp.]